MSGHTAYHKTIPGLVHTGLTDDEFKNHLELGTWKTSAVDDEQPAAAEEQAQQQAAEEEAEKATEEAQEQAQELAEQTAAMQNLPEDGAAPAGNAPLKDWQAYALTKGATPEDIDGKTRAELRKTYA